MKKRPAEDREERGLDKEQWTKVIESLVEFVERTAKNKEAPPAAIMALPEVSRLLFDVTRANAK